VSSRVRRMLWCCPGKLIVLTSSNVILLINLLFFSPSSRGFSSSGRGGLSRRETFGSVVRSVDSHSGSISNFNDYNHHFTQQLPQRRAPTTLHGRRNSETDFDNDADSTGTWREEDEDDVSDGKDPQLVGKIMQQPNIDITPLLANSNDQNNPDIAYFYLRDTLGLSEETMWKITLDAGSLLGMTPRNLDKKVSLLRRTMNLSDEDVRVILGKQPALLHYSAERNLAPTILFLVRALDLSKGELRGMIIECPSILGYSLENLKKKFGFFF